MSETSDVHAEIGYPAREPFVSSRDLEAEAAAASAAPESSPVAHPEALVPVIPTDVEPDLKLRFTPDQKARNTAGFGEARARLAAIGSTPEATPTPAPTRQHVHGAAILRTVAKRK